MPTTRPRLFASATCKIIIIYVEEKFCKLDVIELKITQNS